MNQARNDEEVRLTVRLPAAIHAELADLAERERRTLNGQLLLLVERALGEAQPLPRMRHC